MQEEGAKLQQFGANRLKRYLSPNTAPMPIMIIHFKINDNIHIIQQYMYIAHFFISDLFVVNL